MIQSRVEEKSAECHFRASRIYFIGGNGWYFLTREGISFGPYVSKAEAENHVSLFLFMLERGRLWW
ncbi:MAG: DUF6316 family protein [Cellvibrionaceae bacterium]|jgi:hypothetical protein